MRKELNCLQRPENKDLIEEWEIIRNVVRIRANIHNVDLSKIYIVEERDNH